MNAPARGSADIKRSHASVKDLRRRSLPFEQVFFPQGRGLLISTNRREVLSVADQMWGAYPRLFHHNPARLRVIVSHAAPPWSQLPPSCHVDGHRVNIHVDESNFATGDLQAGVGCIFFTSKHQFPAEYLSYHFLEPLGYLLAGANHFTLLHAASIVHNRGAILLCGDSGAGKTCLAYSAAKRGWSYLSGDATGLALRTRPPQVVGRPFEIRFRDKAVSLFPELAAYPAVKRPNGKRDIQLDPRRLGVRTAFRARVSHIVFLDRQEGADTALTPATHAECKLQLASSVCFGDERMRRAQFDGLDRLLSLPRFKLRYSNLDSAEQALRSLTEGG